MADRAAVAADRRAHALAGLLGLTGSLHLLAPGFFDAIVPRVLPGPARAWTYLSGVAELACAGLVARPPTRRVGGWLAAALFVAVLPGNVQMALDWMDRSRLEQAAVLARLPLQIPLVLWARRVALGPSR